VEEEVRRDVGAAAIGTEVPEVDVSIGGKIFRYGVAWEGLEAGTTGAVGADREAEDGATVVLLETAWIVLIACWIDDEERLGFRATKSVARTCGLNEVAVELDETAEDEDDDDPNEIIGTGDAGVVGGSVVIGGTTGGEVVVDEAIQKYQMPIKTK
jgi:hypothetical protein